MTNKKVINEINSMYTIPTDAQFEMIQRIIRKYKFEDAPSTEFIKEHWFE